MEMYDFILLFKMYINGIRVIQLLLINRPGVLFCMLNLYIEIYLI